MYRDAEKLVKRQMKRYNSNMQYIDLGLIYEAQGDEKKAEDAYQDAIRSMPQSQGIIIRTANEFIRLNKLDYAMETYNYGKSLLNNTYPFSYELASLYGSMGQYERMIEAYLDLLEYNEAYLQTVQNGLNRSINFDEDEEKVEMLRIDLLRRVQKTPESTVYSQLLIWLFLQQKEFESAFIQLKALDKRLNEDGQRLLNLASLCVNNDAFGVAEQCYEYIAEKGPSNDYYPYAKAGILKARFEIQRRIFPPDTVALMELLLAYEATLVELGSSGETAMIMRQKAMLEAYYLNDLLAANITLNEALELPNLHPQSKAEMKLELAEILIARDYIWDASLLISQVDKDFKHDVIGFQAKFMNAQISYYTGDFGWSQAQLDVLKGSTSKLISNDAMELSLLLTDNLNLDTITDPMERFARADLLIVQRIFGEATLCLDSISELYPQHALSDEILLRHAQIAEDTYDYESAVDYYNQVVTNHYFDISADNALFNMAELYEVQLNQPDQAKELYKQLMIDFPGSLYVVESRKRYRALRGDNDPKTEEFMPIEKQPTQ
jgi:tetratricopeptide (TPR) repeat protein